jgi:hypothetical protein
MKLVVIILSIFLLTSCDCGCDVTKYGKFKYQKGDIAYNKISDIKILILDTIRVDCELYYEVIDTDADYYHISEVELK